MKKLLSIFLLVVLLTSVFCVSFANPALAIEETSAADKTGKSAEDGDKKSASSIINSINIVQPDDPDNKISGIAGQIIGAIRFASAIAAVVLIAVFGFQFIMGSAEEKKDYQKKFIPLIVGLVVVFSATYIAQVLFKTLGE